MAWFYPQIRKMSVNEAAEQIVGRRGADNNHATPICDAWELGCECPLCWTKVKFDKAGDLNEGEIMTFSEYDGFVWCPNCNLDIPFFLCIPPTWYEGKRERVEYQIRNFLDYIKKMQGKVIGADSDVEKAQLVNQVKELKKEVQYYKDLKFGITTSYEDFLKGVEKDEKRDE